MSGEKTVVRTWTTNGIDHRVVVGEQPETGQEFVAVEQRRPDDDEWQPADPAGEPYWQVDPEPGLGEAA